MSGLPDFLARIIEIISGTKGFINLEINVDNIKLIDELKVQLAHQIQLTKNIDLSVMVSKEKQSVQIYSQQNRLPDRISQTTKPETAPLNHNKQEQIYSIPQLPIKIGKHLIIDQIALWDTDSTFQSYNFKLIPVRAQIPKRFESIHLKSAFEVKVNTSPSGHQLLLSYEDEGNLRTYFENGNREVVYQKLARLAGNNELDPIESIKVSKFSNQDFFCDKTIPEIVVSIDQEIADKVNIMYLIEYCNQAHATEYYLIVVKN